MPYKPILFSSKTTAADDLSAIIYVFIWVVFYVRAHEPQIVDLYLPAYPQPTTTQYYSRVEAIPTNTRAALCNTTAWPSSVLIKQQ